MVLLPVLFEFSGNDIFMDFGNPLHRFALALYFPQALADRSLEMNSSRLQYQTKMPVTI